MVDDPALFGHGPDHGRWSTPTALVETDRGRLLFGTTTWADRTLVAAATFYPRRSMTARARLGYYASRFPLAEIATTYRFPPTPDLAAQWVDRTPPGFTLDVRAWSLLTGAPTLPDSLWPDLQAEVRDRSRDLRRLYSTHLPDEAFEECWHRFAHALRPLHDAGRLGVVILQYPRWFSPRPETWAELALARRRLPDYRLAVEFHNPRWVEGEACEATLEWLEDQGLGFVCLDTPEEGPRAVPRVAAATSDVAVVRMIGRRQVDGEPWTWPYRYSDHELAEWLPRLGMLSGSADEVHVLLDNSWGTDAVDNAADLARLTRTYVTSEAACTTEP